MTSLPPEATLMEGAGRNVRRLGRTVETLPGRGSEAMERFLDDRAVGQPTRVIDAIETYLAPTNGFDAARGTDAARKDDAAQLSERAYAKHIVWRARLEHQKGRPAKPAAIRTAARRAGAGGGDTLRFG